MSLQYHRKLNSGNANTDVPADKGLDALTRDGCHAHGHGFRGGEPVGIIITRCKIANIVDVAEQEWHRAELP